MTFCNTIYADTNLNLGLFQLTHWRRTSFTWYISDYFCWCLALLEL